MGRSSASGRFAALFRSSHTINVRKLVFMAFYLTPSKKKTCDLRVCNGVAFNLVYKTFVVSLSVRMIKCEFPLQNFFEKGS